MGMISWPLHFFFFKQKTAYEMRISDWSSDVCSSDLQLVDEGRNVASAEANLYKQIALYRIGKARTGAIALAAGGFLAFAGLIAALVGLLMGLDRKSTRLNSSH